MWFLLLFWTGAATGIAQSITVKTSDPLRGLTQKWADAYVAGHTQARIEVGGDGTAEVFAAFAARKSDVAITSRKIRFKEVQACEAAFGQRPTEFKVGVIGAAVYVHADNPVTTLMYEDLEAIYLGKRRNWKQAGGPDAAITVYGVGTNTLAGELFVAEVLTGKMVTNDVRLVAPAELAPALARDVHAIGFGDFANLPDLRVVRIKRAYSSTPVAPDPEAIGNRIYPITQFVYAYVNPEANHGGIKAIVDWLRGDEGRQAVVATGCFAVAPKWRTP